jgi:ferredoxin
MGAILKQNKVIPDCFSCGVCLEACPTGSISFSAGKREKPPEDKFIGNTSCAAEGRQWDYLKTPPEKAG